MTRVDHPSPDELEAISALVAAEQVRPDRCIPYFSDGAGAIAQEIQGDTPWVGRTWVLRTSGIVGALVAETDDELDRVWWTGPFVAAGDWQRGADLLYEAARTAVPHYQEELAGDHRHRYLAEFARRNGFHAEEASAALLCTTAPPPPDVPCRPVLQRERPHVAAMHDRVFPGTHSPGTRLVGRDDPDLMCLVTHVGGSIAGYIAVEVQPDGSGYIDFVGVGADYRRRGLGRALVASATRALFERGVRYVHLTVRAGNAAARRLYTDLGFVEDRVIVPYRKGFSLD